MPSENTKEHHIGASRTMSIANLLAEAGIGQEAQRILHPACERSPDLEDVEIIRADGSREPVYRPGAETNAFGLHDQQTNACS